jgi:polar amino acid transport system substrate-binding protein
MRDNQFWVVVRQMIARLAICFVMLLPFAVGATDLRVMTTPFPPYVIYDEDTHRAHGPAVEVIEQICQSSGMNCQILVKPWARAYAIALEHPNTLIFSIARRPDRELQFKWIGTVAPYQVRLFSVVGSGVPVVENWRELSAFGVAGQLRDVKAQYLEKAGFEVEMVPSAETTIRMLFANRAKLVAGDALSLPYRVRMLEEDSKRLQVVAIIPELSTDLYLAASLSTADRVVAQMRAALEDLKSDGSYDRIWIMSTALSTN